MNIEYEEFGRVEDMFLYLSAAAPPMKNTIPINSYKGHVMTFIPLGTNGDNYLMMFSKGEIEPGIYEFDPSAHSHKKVQVIERADKTYFIVVTPVRHSLGDAALARPDFAS